MVLKEDGEWVPSLTMVFPFNNNFETFLIRCIQRDYGRPLDFIETLIY